jgi:hypothetical protein
MKLYSIQVYYSLKDNAYAERQHLKCCYSLYKSKEEAVEAVKKEVEENYAHSKNYRNFKAEYPHFSKYGWINGYFECNYIFGPFVHYSIHIVEHRFD